MATPEEQKKLDEEKKRREEAARKASANTQSSSTHSASREAKTGAATSTYNAQRGNDPLADPRGDTFLTHDEIKSLAGDIERGELAHLKLDEEGKPTGTVFREIPSPDDVTTTVIGTPTVKFDEIVTPSGAPISKYMNPDPVLWDAGMLARNPLPPEDKDSPRGPIGGGVINQPVRV